MRFARETVAFMVEQMAGHTVQTSTQLTGIGSGIRDRRSSALLPYAICRQDRGDGNQATQQTPIAATKLLALVHRTCINQLTSSVGT